MAWNLDVSSPQRMTAIIEREDNGFVALCPELDIASEGATIVEARANPVEALTLFFEAASSPEMPAAAQRGFCQAG
jgi:predicted RNase H-like HicB family nuclease